MFKTATIAEQVTSHLREGLQQKRWTGNMPGRSKLAAELGVNVKTVERALAQLEQEGLLESQGAGRRRRIVASKQQATPAMQVKIILYERSDADSKDILKMRRALEAAGHRISYAPKTLLELKQDPKRVTRMMKADTAKIWIVVAAARPVLESLAKSSVSVFALFGRLWELKIAGGGPEKDSALKETVQRLTDLGHQRIVMLTRRERRHPDYGPIEKLFLEEMEARGITSGGYNIPEWEESAKGLRESLDNLFRLTPPSAIIVSDSALCLAIKNYLASHQGRDLRNVAMICTDYHSHFDWCAPNIAHFSWDSKPLVKRVVRWVNNVAAGKDDRRQNLYPVKFISGNAIQEPVERH